MSKCQDPNSRYPPLFASDRLCKSPFSTRPTQCALRSIPSPAPEHGLHPKLQVQNRVAEFTNEPQVCSALDYRAIVYLPAIYCGANNSRMLPDSFTTRSKAPVVYFLGLWATNENPSSGTKFFCFIFTGLRSRKTIFSEICSSLRVNAFPLLCPVVRYRHMHRTNSANTFIFNDGLSCKQGFSSGLYTALIGEVLSFRLERQTSSTAAELWESNRLFPAPCASPVNYLHGLQRSSANSIKEK